MFNTVFPFDAIAVSNGSTGPPPPPPFNCTENVSLTDDVISSFDVAVTVTSTEPVAPLPGVSTRLPLPSSDAVSFAGSELETVYVNKSDSVTTSAFSIFTKSFGRTMLSELTFQSGRSESAVFE